jgi:hypothetical protein
MPIIVEENQKGKLKRRQSYRSQRENTSEDSNGYDEADGMKYGGMKKKTKKMKYGGMHKKKKVIKASKGEMALKDFVEEGVFEPGSRAYEKVMQDDVDQAAKRYDTIKGARKALKKIKLKEKMKSGLGYARAVPGLGSLAGSVAGIAADMKSSTPTMGKEGSFKKGGMSKARGTGCAIRGTKFKGIF